MIQGKCPICGQMIRGDSLDVLPYFPFCSDRCRLVDLGRWIDGDYKLSRPLEPEEMEDMEVFPPEDDETED